MARVKLTTTTVTESQFNIEAPTLEIAVFMAEGGSNGSDLNSLTSPVDLTTLISSEIKSVKVIGAIEVQEMEVEQELPSSG